jgi:hypothetical protein
VDAAVAPGLHEIREHPALPWLTLERMEAVGGASGADPMPDDRRVAAALALVAFAAVLDAAFFAS